MAVIYDFHEVTPPLRTQGRKAPVLKHEQVGARQGSCRVFMRPRPCFFVPAALPS